MLSISFEGFKHFILSITNITKITKFHHLDIWSQSDCIELMRWHLKHERHFKRGINNNISLCNYSISVGEISYSLLNYRFDVFQPALMVICPFKAYTDARGIIRMATTFRRLKIESRWYDRHGDEIISDERKYIINMFCEHIQSGFSWTGNPKNYQIRRYRLNALCSQPNLVLNRTIDCHHRNTLKSILDVTDDRFSNLSIMPRDEHYQLHIKHGDDGFIDM